MLATSRVDLASRSSHNLFVIMLADCNSDSNVNRQNSTWIRARKIRHGICVFDVVVILQLVKAHPFSCQDGTLDMNFVMIGPGRLICCSWPVHVDYRFLILRLAFLPIGNIECSGSGVGCRIRTLPGLEFCRVPCLHGIPLPRVRLSWRHVDRMLERLLFSTR